MMIDNKVVAIAHSTHTPPGPARPPQKKNVTSAFHIKFWFCTDTTGKLVTGRVVQGLVFHANIITDAV